MIEFSGVNLSAGGRTLLKDFSWQMPDPGIYLLLGGNGSGKTLLSDLLRGQQRGFSGEINLMGEPVSRLGGQVWYADAAIAIRDAESVEEYVDYELSCSGASGDSIDECLKLLENRHRRIRDAALFDLPHHEVLLVQIAVAMFVAGPLRILDGHLTYLDGKHCRLASQMLQQFSASQQQFLLMTTARVADELPELRDLLLLSGEFPLEINRVDGTDGITTDMRKIASSTSISVYYRNRRLNPYELTSGETYRVLNRLEGGLNLELSGSLDECIRELASKGIEISRIDLQSP